MSVSKAEKPSLINRIIRANLRVLTALLGQSNAGKKMARLESTVSSYGLKYTIKSVIQNSTTKKTSPEEPVTDIARQLAENPNRLNSLRASMLEDAHRFSWLTEQNIPQHSCQKEVNDLRQRKKALILGSCEHSNLGDCAIILAEQQILCQQFPEYFQLEISTYEFGEKEAYLHAVLNHDDIIFIHGGGNIGDCYMVEEDLHRKIVSEFPNHKIVIFPQTISFSATERGMQELEKSARIYNSHRNLTLFVRGETSLAFARKHFPNVKSILMPDVVHTLRCNYPFDRRGVLLCLRDDVERTLGQAQRDVILSTVQSLTDLIDYSNNMHIHDTVHREIRSFVVRRELMRFARQQIVITDRLHGMIFSAITGTPCVVLSSANHKIREYYEAFFHDSNAVFFIGDDVSRLEDVLKQALRTTIPQYPIFEADPHSTIRKLVMQPNCGDAAAVREPSLSF